MRALYRAGPFFGAACVALGLTFIVAQALALGACTTTPQTASPTTATSGTTSSQDTQQQARADPNKQAKPQPKGY